MRKEITEDQITELMRAIPRAEEVERLRAEVERLQAEKDLDASSLVLQRQEIERLTRERDEARYFLAIFLHAHASGNSVPPHIEGQARKALGGKP